MTKDEAVTQYLATVSAISPEWETVSPVSDTTFRTLLFITVHSLSRQRMEGTRREGEEGEELDQQ